MKCINVKYALNGDVLGLPVVLDNGVILLKENTILSTQFIKRIKANNIRFIYILQPQNNDSTYFEYKNYDTLMETGSLEISKIYMKVLNYETIEIKELTEVVEDVIAAIQSSKQYPVQLLTELRNKNENIYKHCINTCFLSTFIGEYMNLNTNELKVLSLGALLHDIGKTMISDNILKKESKLTFDEFETIKRHTIFGFEILKNMRGIDYNSCLIALNHHEKFNGCGYPRGLSGSEIDLYSQIVAIADVYDALISVRSYKRSYKPDETYKIILSGSGIHFDSLLVNVFRKCLLIYPNGSIVKLSNGNIGIIKSQNPRYPDKPTITIKLNNNTNEYEINLMKNLNISIIDIL